MTKQTAQEKLLKIMEASETEVAPRSGKSAFNISLAKLNMLLMIGLVLSLGYLGFEVVQGLSLLETSVNINVAQRRGDSNNLSALPRNKSIDFYLGQFNQRNIFTPYVEEVTQTQAAKGLAVKMEKYALVGVAWLDVPESASVMIEDKGSGVTHFLQEGDKIEDVTVKTIYIDRVVFGYENEEIVIKL